MTELAYFHLPLYPSQDMMEQPPTSEQIKPFEAKTVLHEFGFQEGTPVPAIKVREMILKYEKEIIAGLARNYYHNIKKSLFYPKLQATRSPYYVMRQESHRRRGQEHQYLDFMWFLETKADELKDARSQNDEFKIVFTFCADQARIEDEEQKSTLEMFTGYDIFRVEKIMFGTIPMITFNQRGDVESLPELREVNPGTKTLSYGNVRKFLECTLYPPELFENANTRLDQMWTKHGFPIKDARLLKQAIWEFGNHDFLEREGYRMIGRCLTIPRDFISFMKKRHGIELLECELTGARKSRLELDPEEIAELAAEQAGMVVHMACVY